MTSLYRIAQNLCSAIIGAVILSLFLIPVITHPVAAAQAFSMAVGIGGFWWFGTRENHALGDQIAEATAVAWSDARRTFEREAPVPAHMRPMPEAARLLHDDMSAEIKALRDQVTRVVSVASAMHRDRAAVHERCAVLEQENNHYRAQVMTYSQAKDILASLPGPPLQPNERPWAAAEPHNIDTEKLLTELSQIVDRTDSREVVES